MQTLSLPDMAPVSPSSELPANCPSSDAAVTSQPGFDTQHMLAELETLRKAEAKFRGMFENCVEGIFQTTPDGQYLSANPALARIYGYDSSYELMHRLDDIEQQLYVQPQRRAEFIELIERQGFVTDFESEVYRKDRSIIWISENSRAILDESGRVRCYEGTVMDITRRRQAEAELAVIQDQLLDTARRDGMAEIATGVLHNVGNVLNSVNVSATLATDHLRQSKLSTLGLVAKLVNEHKHDLADFISHDQRGRQLPAFLTMLAGQLEQERDRVLEELALLIKNIDHIKTVVVMQQSYASTSGISELVSLPELLDDAVRLNEASFARHGIDLVRQYAPVPEINVAKQKLLQILVNLVKNAKDSVSEARPATPRIMLRICRTGADRIVIEIEDNGVGIPAENLTRIFSHGFTTKRNGHGFGLHASANTARQLGGSLTASSGGPGQGATFALELPRNVGGAN